MKLHTPFSGRSGNGPLAARWGGACATCLLILAVLVFPRPAAAQRSPASLAAALQARRTELLPQLRASAFGQPVYLSSREGEDRVEGDVHADVAHPFESVAAVFRSGAAVCELLFLHQNVRACRSSTEGGMERLALTVGPKRAGSGGMRYPMDYTLRIEASAPGYLRATLVAMRGPLSTRDYRIVFEAVALDASRSFVHLGYAYSYGTLARIAMRAYLATAGQAKIGFTVEGRDEQGQPRYVRGERAALERNVIRYYLALLAHLGVTTGTPQAQMDARLRAWFALTERHAAQLHELDLQDYLAEKRDDLARNAAAPR
jgi:hypothetical protein